MDGVKVLGLWTAVAAGIASVVGWAPLSVWLEGHDNDAKVVSTVVPFLYQQHQADFVADLSSFERIIDAQDFSDMEIG